MTHSTIPPEPYGALFRRYLRFGLLAWGGPVAQIAMIRQELVEDKRWISPDHFNRVLAVYQVLPGPEAHEMCVYFGMLSRGRLGGLLAGLGFMLPGLILMLALSAVYVSGNQAPLFQAFFLGVQPTVIALVIRAVHRIGGHAVRDGWLWGIALAAGLAHLAGLSFWITLPAGGAFYLLVIRRRRPLASAAAVLLLAAVLSSWSSGAVTARSAAPEPQSGVAIVSPTRLFISGLRSGLLTFGGAYTVLPFLRRDAVERGRWMSDEEFLDGVALSGILPAPFIIFSTFVGYLGGGVAGALLLTVGIFLPAFGFTLAGHQAMERLINHREAHTFLDGVTAGVVGLIAATALQLSRPVIATPAAPAIFALALVLLYRWRTRTAVAGVVLGGGIAGLLLY